MHDSLELSRHYTAWMTQNSSKDRAQSVLSSCARVSHFNYHWFVNLLQKQKTLVHSPSSIKTSDLCFNIKIIIGLLERKTEIKHFNECWKQTSSGPTPTTWETGLDKIPFWNIDQWVEIVEIFFKISYCDRTMTCPSKSSVGNSGIKDFLSNSLVIIMPP